MRKWIFTLTLLVTTNWISAQNDLGIDVPNGAILAPATGCGLSNNETVTVRVFNFGPGTVSVNFDLRYTITGPINTGPITETVVGPNILPNSAYIYSFATTADMSVPGTYTINAEVILAGDPISTNNQLNGHIVVHNAPSVGGSVSGGTNVCFNSNSGTLTLSGHTGSVLNWETSTDGGVTWTNIGNTGTTQAYLNLTVPTLYRAVVQNASCPPASSSAASMTIDPTTVGGTLNANTTICTGSSTTSTLSGFTGTIQHWEYSIDGGVTWNIIAHTGSSYNSGPLTTTTRFRVRVQSGSCPGAYSNQRIVNVSPATVGGSISPVTQTVCSGSNSGTLTLSGHTGNIIRWEFSTDGGVTWNNIANTTTTQNFLNLTQTTDYRVRVQSSPCAVQYSAIATVVVTSSTVAGSVSADVTECEGSNSGTLTLVGYSGSILNWESSTDGGVTWNNIANTTDNESYLNLTQTTIYRAQVQNGICAPAYSVPATVTISPSSDGGNLNSDNTVCALGNSGSITLSGNTGSVLNWESSTDGGLTWNNIANTTTTENYNNLTSTTLYRVIVQSGVCPPDFSDTVTITVDQPSVGGSVMSNTTVCEGINSGTLNLTGETGSVVNWELSIDGGLTWSNISNTTTSQNYNNITQTTFYRANVQNGTCPAALSNYAAVTVDPLTQGGVLLGSTTVCEGTNSGTLTLVGHVSTIQLWESSTDGGITWSPIVNSTNQLNYSNINQTTDFRVIVESGVCPTDTSTLATITILPKPNADFLSDTVCLGQPINFINQTTIPPGYLVLYLWDFGDGQSSTNANPAHTYAVEGNYNVQLIAMSNFGCLDTIQYVAGVEPVPDATIGSSGPLSFCDGGNVDLFVPFITFNSYLWSTSQTTNLINVTSSGTYTVTVTDNNNGCVASDSVIVTVYPNPSADAGIDTTINMGDAVVLQGSGGVGYQWTPATSLDNPFSPNPTAMPAQTTTYTLVVTNINGCTSTDSVTITLSDVLSFNIHDIITPNGDGFNEFWIIENIINFPDNEVTIFNRNGQIVYKKSSYDNTWGGTFNGQVLPDGTYYYTLKVNGISKPQKGAINIISSDK
jgi:gliding motility-associated-like protein